MKQAKVFLTKAEAARMVGISPAAILAAANDGRLRVAARTPSGVRLFERADVLLFMAARMARIGKVAA